MPRYRVTLSWRWRDTPREDWPRWTDLEPEEFLRPERRAKLDAFLDKERLILERTLDFGTATDREDAHAMVLLWIRSGCPGEQPRPRAVPGYVRVKVVTVWPSRRGRYRVFNSVEALGVAYGHRDLDAAKGVQRVRALYAKSAANMAAKVARKAEAERVERETLGDVEW